MAELDPLTQVYNSLWDMLESRQAIHSMVRIGNRTKFNIPLPLKDEVSTSDLPELRVVTSGSTPHIFRTSNSSSVVKRYEVIVITGDQRFEVLFPLEFEILRALSTWPTKVAMLTWNSVKFVNLVRPTTSFDDLLQQEALQRGIKGWITIWSVEVQMFFQTITLQGDN